MKTLGSASSVTRLAAIIFTAILLTQSGLPQLEGVESPKAKSQLDPASAILSPQPLPALLEATQKAGIDLSKTNTSFQHLGLWPGDSANALVTLQEKGSKIRQWLIHFQVSPDRTNSAPHSRERPEVIYSSTGLKFKFLSTNRSMSLRTLGPFQSVGGKPKKGKTQDLKAEAVVNEGFLALGLNRAAAAIERVVPSKGSGDLFWFSQSPPTPGQTTKGKALAEALGITAEDERALCAAGPALMSYLMLTQNSPGLQDIYYALMDWGSVWSVLSNGGVRNVNLAFQSRRVHKADETLWNLPRGVGVHYLPVQLEMNKRPVLEITLVVTDPNPSFLMSGGIIALMAVKPGDDHILLTLRLLNQYQMQGK
jgi:hypothetical protein